MFKTKVFIYPYTDHRFPGQANDEVIFYIAREARIMLAFRILGISLISLTLLIGGSVFTQFIGSALKFDPSIIQLIIILLVLIFWGLAYWWIKILWTKSIFIITNRRLTKLIYSTPFNHYSLSITLDQIMDTGAYNKGYFQALFHIGTFTARSGAGNRPEKYFFVENIYYYEDLANYVNKILYIFRHTPDKLTTFHPFIPYFKGQNREDSFKKYPQYWN